MKSRPLDPIVCAADVVPAASEVVQHRPRLTFVLGVLTAFGAASTDMYLPSLPAIGVSLKASPASVQLTLATFMGGMGIGQLVYGPLSDRLGRRNPLLFGIVLFVCASVGCAFAPTIEALIAMRLVQALGAAAGSVISRAVVRDLYEGKEVARVMSLMMLIMGAVPILAPLVGGTLVIWMGWRAIFGVLAGFGVFALVLAVPTIPRGRRNASPGAFVPNLKALFADPTFVRSTFVGGFAAAVLFAYIASVSFVFMSVYHFSPQAFALVFGLNAAGFIGASQLNRALLTRFTMEGLARVAALGLCGAVATLALVVYQSHASVLGVAASLFMCLACIGMLVPNCTALALTHHAARAGTASSVIGATHFALSALVVTSLGVIGDGSAKPMVWVLATCAGCAGLLSTRLRR
jgi:DHA1 family bicyclomycin/chloramphenicol resistance-like MFS transporter